MKKLLFFVCLFITVQLSAQDTYTVTKVTVKVKNNFGKFFDYQITRPDDMYLVIDKNHIRVGNESRSSYTTFGPSVKRTTSTYKEAEWKAIDEEGKYCKMAIILYTNGIQVIFVSYEDLIVIYNIE